MKGGCLTYRCHVWISGNVIWNHNQACVFLCNNCAYQMTMSRYGHSLTYAIVTLQKVWHKSELSIHMVNYIYVYTRESSWNPNSNALVFNRWHHVCPAACVITQQYPSATSSHCAVIPTRKNSVWISNMLLFFITLNGISQGLSVNTQ